ncbi:MAG: pilus assembly protein N-terminal domain-containing protein [Pirellulales bacterium]
MIRKISGRTEKLELTTNTSRILTLDKNIPRVQVNNPELVAVTPLSATDVQISAKKAGVTQVNLWDEDGNIHTVDVLIYGDARELTIALQTQFPHSSIRVYRYSESLVLTGFVDRPDHVGPIMRLAEDYAPKVINNINVGGVQQILLKVKVMEISRTKLRRLDVDWAYVGANGGFALNSVNDILSFDDAEVVANNNDTFSFGIVNNGDRFLGFLDALQENRIAKTLAEPNLVAVSGRPAQFNVGGEFPVVIPQSLGTSSIEYKPFGTQIDFLPIVLGNGNIRLEVRPRVSDLDFSIPIDLNGTILPALKVRQVDTAVEMKAGQTFAIAGLVQEKTVSSKSGFPYISDLPIIGVPFRGTENNVEEVELLILVTPEFVDPIDAHEMPCGGPGYATTNPNNRQLYCGGHVEVPAHCNPISGMTACGEGNCGDCNGCANGGNGPQHGEYMPVITDGVTMPGGTGYDESMTITDQQPQEQVSNSPAPTPANAAPMPAPNSAPADVPQPLKNVPDDLPLPGETEQPNNGAPDGARFQPLPTYQLMPSAAMPPHAAPGPYTPPRQPVFMRNASRPHNPQPALPQSAPRQGQTGLIGPVGYDVQ